MDITIPEVPAGIMTLLAFFAPYAVALINRPGWSTAQRRVMGVAVPVVLAIVVWVLYFAMTGEGLGSWPQLILLAVVVTQASYALVTEKGAKAIEYRRMPDDADPEGEEGEAEEVD